MVGQQEMIGNLLSSIQVQKVEPGTVITCGDEELVVDENNAVRKGNSIYVTPLMYDKLRTHPDIKDAPSALF